MTTLTTFDIRNIPFSRRGAWINLSPVVGLHDIRDDIYLVSHQSGMNAVFRFAFPDATHLTTEASPAVLRWTADDGAAIATFESEDVIRVRGNQLTLVLAEANDELTPFTGTYAFVDPRDGSAIFTSYETGRRYRVTPLSGEWVVTGDQSLGDSHREVRVAPDAAGNWEIAIEEFETTRPPYSATESFDDIAARVQSEFLQYADHIAPWRSADIGRAAELAAYVLWSATVRPGGFLQRESILMSKHWMDKVWTWDHCFNALALAEGLPAEAMEQFLVVFDQQDEFGALPDSITHSEVLDNFVKPPIHGWAFELLRKRMPSELSRDQLADVYDKIAAWTGFWLDSRRVSGQVLPHYHHGNDSGWDNSTMFDRDRVVQAPDLAAFLILQLDALARLGNELGRDVSRWSTERTNIQQALEALWSEDAFVATSPTSGRASTTSSLLNLMAVVVADRLPARMADGLAASIQSHLTDWGLATERLDSPEYENDGYWRGPIWAPSTVLIEDGLRRAGRIELADEISDKFLRLCEQGGFAENFDALTGHGLRDRAYTWTASAYLILAAQQVGRDHGAER